MGKLSRRLRWERRPDVPDRAVDHNVVGLGGQGVRLVVARDEPARPAKVWQEPSLLHVSEHLG